MNLLLALLCALARDAELEQARADFKKALAELNPTALHTAAERLAATDQKAATDTLMDGYGKCAVTIKAFWGDKVKLYQDREASADFKIDYKTTPPSIPPGDVAKYKKWEEADGKLKAVEAKIMTCEAAKIAIVKALAKFKSDASVKYLIHEVTAGADWQRRAAAAEAMGQLSHKEVPAALLEALKKDKEPAVAIAVLDALRELKLSTPEVLAAVAGQLQSEYWQLKIGAARALQAIGGFGGIEPLIDALSKSEGRLKVEFNEALAALTGVNKHGEAAAWKAWLDANRDALAKGTYSAKNAEPGAPAARAQTTVTFYGIPVESKSVIFVLDRSGSMMEPSDWEEPKDAGTPTGPGSDIQKKGDRKIDICRWQIKRSIAQLPEGAEFNVIFFSHDIVSLSDKMLKMSASARKQAFEWIDKLEPYGGTNPFDALERALTYAAGGISGEKLQKSGVDTICLMTDGMPTAGQLAKVDEILAGIRALNKTRKVKIHTVGVFTVDKGGDQAKQLKEKEDGIKFLKQLAEDNGGKFTGSGVIPVDKPDPKKPDGK